MMTRFFVPNVVLCRSTVNAGNSSTTLASEFPVRPRLWISGNMIRKTIPYNSEESL
jgi:hypothetical protein